MNKKNRTIYKIVLLLSTNLVFTLLSSGCFSDSSIQESQATGDVALINSYTPTKLNTVSSITSTATISPDVSNLVTPTIPPSATTKPTEKSNWMQVTMTASGKCITPMSLMLHSNYGPERMEELAQIIEENDLETITYDSLYEDYLYQGKCPPRNTLLVSVDDLDLDGLLPVYREMIQVFIEHNMVLTVGVITTEPHIPEVWEYLNSIQKEGMQIASHTVNHPDLASLSEEEVWFELEESYKHICDNTKRCPNLLILPYGNYNSLVRKIAGEIGYLGILSVSVPGEGKFGGGDSPDIFIRVGPNLESQHMTLFDLKVHYYENQ